MRMALPDLLLRPLLACLCVFPLLAQAATTEAPDDPWLMLEKAGQAAHKLNYKGIFVFQTGRAARSMQITHMNYAQGEFARVVALDGVPQEVLRQGNDVVIYNQQNDRVVIERHRVQSAFPALLPGLVETLKASYQVRLAGQERVGGREVQVIYLDPRDHFRYGYRLSVDREFGLLLKSVLFNERNEPIEQVAFNQLLVMSMNDMDWFRPGMESGKMFVVAPEDSVKPIVAEGDGWVIAQLPAGYRQLEHVQRKVPGKSFPIDHVVFSDGLCSVSLFIEPLDKSSTPKQGSVMQGATNIFAQTSHGYQVIVVGEVPEVTVKQIAAAVNFKK